MNRLERPEADGSRVATERRRQASRKRGGAGRLASSQFFVSTSTLQRLLAAAGTDFTDLRKEAQIQVALKLLTQGKSARAVAGEVNLTPDHPCVLVRCATDLTPAQIIRASKLAAKVQRWSKYGPPPYGPPLYRRQICEWNEIDAFLQGLLVDLDAHHPLATWAKDFSSRRLDQTSARNHIAGRFAPVASWRRTNSTQGCTPSGPGGAACKAQTQGRRCATYGRMKTS